MLKRPPAIHPERQLPGENDPAGAIVRLLAPASWIPAREARWAPLIEAVLNAFLREFEPALLAKLLKDQIHLPLESPPAARAVLLAAESTAFHKLCQLFARSEFIPKESRDLLVPLENLPPSTIPDAAQAKALDQAAREWRVLGPELRCEKIGRGSVADVFLLTGRKSPVQIAFKVIRADSSERVQKEARILLRLAEQSAEIGLLVGPEFARSLSEAFKDASRSLLREIDFQGEAENLADARRFYLGNEQIRIPKLIGPRVGNGVFMEFLKGGPLFENSLGSKPRREVARILFRSLILEPLFSGCPESIFHADPHAGNIRLQTGQRGEIRVVLLDWSQAGRLSTPIRHALIELCMNCYEYRSPAPELIGRLLGRLAPAPRTRIPQGENPIDQALRLVEQLAIDGLEVPLSLLLLRKSFLTLEGITRQLDPNFNSWRETLRYAGWVFASETPFRLLSLPLPLLDSPRFYRTGLPTKLLVLRGMELFVRSHNFSLTPTSTLCDSLASGSCASREEWHQNPRRSRE